MRQRMYEPILHDHFTEYRQMVFLAGPRQVGKTSCGNMLATHVLNWDDVQHRQILNAGPERILAHVFDARLDESPAVLLLDEIHKAGSWKTLLKGLYDRNHPQLRIIVTGSSRLDVFRRGGDSLMGRYFLHHMHPFSVGELHTPQLPDENLIRPAQILVDDEWEQLLTHGGFPDPFIHHNKRFSHLWHKRRLDQLFHEDIRDLTRVQELGQLELLGTLLQHRSGEQLIYANVASEIRVSQDTARRWIETFTALHFGFLIRPWHSNVSRSLRKEPKWFLRDWADISDPGKRFETLIACHLLKAVDTWNDCGFGDFALHYLRDKNKREVDFIVIKNNTPWFLVEAKLSDTSLSPQLHYFQQQTGAQHAFQVVQNIDYQQANCFAHNEPRICPAQTFLAQLP